MSSNAKFWVFMVFCAVVLFTAILCSPAYGFTNPGDDAASHCIGSQVFC